MPEQEPIKAINPFFKKRSFYDFVNSRKVAEADFPLIDELTKFSTDKIIANLHNFFTSNKGNAAAALEYQIQIDKKKNDAEPNDAVFERIRLYETILPFARKYDWTACYNLVSILERKDDEDD